MSSSLLGYGLYFIDVLACLLFCITLALASARFGHEHSVEIDLPRAEAAASAGTDLSGASIHVRSRGGEPEIFLEDERVSLAELEERLRGAPPPAVVVRSEVSTLAGVIAAAHAAGVLEIQLAYETRRTRP